MIETTMVHFTPITDLSKPAPSSPGATPSLTTLFDPDPDDLEDDVAALLAPAYHYFAARDDDGDLVGFCCFGEDAQVPGGDYALPALDVGMGLRPDLTGRGHLPSFFQAVLAWGDALFAPEYYRATVGAINVRSQAMVARAGFLITQRFRAQAGKPGGIHCAVESSDLARTSEPVGRQHAAKEPKEMSLPGDTLLQRAARPTTCRRRATAPRRPRQWPSRRARTSPGPADTPRSQKSPR